MTFCRICMGSGNTRWWNPQIGDEVVEDCFMCGSEEPASGRDRLAMLIGRFPLHTDNRGDDNQVLHDAFAGNYDERTEAVYQLVDEILAEISVQDAERSTGVPVWRPYG